MAAPLFGGNKKQTTTVQPAVKMPTASGSTQPRVDAFTIKGNLNGSLKDIAEIMRTISFLQVAQETDSVNAVYIESRDIKKAPYMFSIVVIKENEIEVLYSIPTEIAPTKRKTDVIRYLMNILSLIEQYYKVDNKIIYQLLENALKEIAESVTLEYSKLYTTHDSMRKDLEDLSKKVNRLNDENQVLVTSNYELKNKNDELLLRLKEIEKMSDETLKMKVQEWIVDHNGEINVGEFAKTHKVIESRVEDILNRLVSEGYLEVLQ